MCLKQCAGQGCRTLTLRPNVKSVFTKILNVVQLFGKPTVVIVTVQPLYCCYCSTPVQLPIFDRNSAKTLRSALFRFSRVFNAILRRFQAIFEAIPSDFERLEHRNQRKTKRFASGRPFGASKSKENKAVCLRPA